MALLHIDFASSALGIQSCMNVIVPQQRQYPPPAGKKEYPVLYLLHGLGDNHTSWQRRTSLERYVESKNLVVVMPTTQRGFYTNTISCQKYYDFIALELPEICAAMLPISTRREDTFAAGNSMGGYGAFKLGLSMPEKFAAVASFSGVLDVCEAAPSLCGSELSHVFGPLNELKGSENDLFALADSLLSSAEPRPKFLQICGTEDFLYQNNQNFLQRYQHTLPIEYIETPGNHNWKFWDSQLETLLQWLPIQN